MDAERGGEMRRFATDRYVPEPDPRYWRRVLGVIALVMVALAVWSWAGPQFRRAMHAPEVVVCPALASMLRDATPPRRQGGTRAWVTASSACC